MTINDIELELFGALPSKTLYHYTSISVLLSIIDKKCLWLSDIKFMNDASEYKHLTDFLIIDIKQRLENGESQKICTQIIQWFKTRLIQGPILHVGSFSENGNQLSQWRGYCHEFKGISLGISGKRLYDKCIEQDFRIGKCIYDNNKKKEFVKIINDELIAEAKRLGPEKDPSKVHPSESYYYCFNNFKHSLVSISSLIKHSKFDEENEWRIVSKPISDYIKTPIKYREGKNTLIPYLEFQLPSSNEKSVELEMLYVGPTINMNHSMESISRFLSKEKSSPKNGISNCQIPYRDF